jgi:hypothetical protein
LLPDKALLYNSIQQMLWQTIKTERKGCFLRFVKRDKFSEFR